MCKPIAASPALAFSAALHLHHLQQVQAQGQAGESEYLSSWRPLGPPLRLPAGAGRDFAALSSDRNPIHMHAALARLFGFRACVAHGMHVAGCAVAWLAALDASAPPSYPRTVTSEFLRPTFLPLEADVLYRVVGTTTDRELQQAHNNFQRKLFRDQFARHGDLTGPEACLEQPAGEAGGLVARAARTSTRWSLSQINKVATRHLRLPPCTH